MAPTRQERKEATTKLRRQQIIEAAFDIFSEKGFATATTAEIARKAGVAEGTIYNYFPSKRDLLIAVVHDFIITTPLLELIDMLPKGDIAGTFTHILQNRFDLLENEFVSRMPFLMAEIIRDPELKASWKKQFLQPFLSRMEGVYRVLSTSGKTRLAEPSVLVRSIGGMLLGFLILKIMEGDDSPMNKLSREQIADTMVNLILHGLLDDRADEKD
jgi:AcrR family transcriptional regulator